MGQKDDKPKDQTPGVDSTDSKFVRDVVGDKADAAVTTVGVVASIVAYVKGLLNQVAAIITSTDEIPSETNSKTWNATALQSIQDESEDALEGEDLDHLLKLDGATEKYPENCATDSILAKLMVKADPAVPSQFDNSTDSLEALADAIAALQTDLGDPSARTNLQTVIAMMGNPDAAGKTLYGNVGDFVGDANLQTLKTALGIPDVLGKPLYTCLVTDRLDNGTYGLSALQVLIAALQTDLDNGTDGLGALKVLIDAVQTDLDNGTDGLGALKTLIDANQVDLDAIITDLDNATDGLGALKTLIDANQTDLDAIIADLDNGTDGLGALKALIDTVDTVVDGIKTVTDNLPDTGALSSLAQASENTSSDSSGTFSYLDAGGEQDVVEITNTTRKVIQGIWLDLDAMTQNGVIKCYHKIDGTNYRQVSVGGTIQSYSFTEVDGIDGVYLDLNMGITSDFKVTYEEDVDEGTARDIPYSIVYRTIE